MTSPVPDPAPGAGRTEPAVTDAHLHLWDLRRSPYRWLGEHPALARTFDWDDARAGHEAMGVTRVVLVQADDTRSDTRHLQETAERIEARAGQVRTADVIAWMPLDRPEEVGALLADPSSMCKVVGVRHLIHDDPDPGFLERPDVSRSLDLLGTAGLPLDVPDAHPRHLRQAVRVARAHPELVLVLDHLGKPPLGNREGMRAWEAGIVALAELPRVVAKVSGLATSGNGRFDGALDAALEAFGPDRLLFGTDWPIAPPPADHGAGSGGTLAAIRRLPPAARDAVLTGTAARVYRRLRD